MHAIGPLGKAILLFFVLQLLLKMMLNGMTFGAALLLQGKSVRDAYVRGAKMLNNHWPYVIGLYAYFMGSAYLVQRFVMPVLAVHDEAAIVVGALMYLLWPLYWAVFLPYHKRALRK